ncbi:PREDICTED: thioredoxin-like 3-2, chloroplastic [Ipomoea nil]|uniref:thioredoxin-like 3-2, chloroplastic n=1 Tax=Ipomoea nil TaxID=35883 RepID=UPI000901050A|nr:PREDICTED: thioredoxin-like 3-2, chloroplastic [Ipomoea nil]
MSNVLQISPASKITYLNTKPPFCFPNFNLIRAIACPPNLVAVCPIKTHFGVGKIEALAKYGEEGSVQGLDDSPASIELQPISSESQFDRVVAEAQQLGESLVILWKASWCRKCIYLKPKLEKLAAGYYPSIRFYSVDVNSVPHKLVVCAGVTKMPTIQVWKDGKKQGEVIGGNKAHLVVNEVREMIENNESAL